MDQAEQLRNIIKANSHPQRPLARVITVTSGKGGVGKSNTSINLAIQFRKMGQKVIILDADFGLANIEIMFGTVPKHNLSDLIYQGKNIKEIITRGPMEVGFISGGSGVAALSNITKDNLSYIIQNLAELDSLADTIIIDTGAGISDAVLEFLVASQEILLITTPEPTSITDSYSLLKALCRHPDFSKEETKVRMIANRVRKTGEGENLYNKLYSVVKNYLRTPMEYLGEIPEDGQLSKAVMQQKPVSLENPGAKSALAYEEIAAKLMNKEMNKNTSMRGMAAIFSHILGKR
ncbi:MinD/ParA family protein [Kineothrix sedimenti]|uniref:MinD/ParA family protein n=1 Tax=Kineothrix sedimenti TaxID=3123317 RepID=A0ABZ3F0N8_9FIRM